MKFPASPRNEFRKLLISGAVALIGFIFMLCKHPYLGFLLFVGGALVLTVKITAIALNTSTETGAKKVFRGGKAGCLSSLIAFILLIVGLVVGMPEPEPVPDVPIEPPAEIVETIETPTETEADISESSSEESEPESKAETEANDVVFEVESKIESKPESKAESMSEEEYTKSVKMSISGAVGSGERITKVVLDNRVLKIDVDLSEAETNPIFFISDEDLAISRACSITDSVLRLDRSYWDKVVVSFKEVGEISKTKSDIVHDEYGDYFLIDELDVYYNNNTKSSSMLDVDESKIESKLEHSEPQRQMSQYVFYGNMDSMCYHTEMCTAAERISDENRFTYVVNAYSLYEAQQEAVRYFESQGYWHCGICAY